jgi:hypothetical protein
MHLGLVAGAVHALAQTGQRMKWATTTTLVEVLHVSVVCQELVTRAMDLGLDAKWCALSQPPPLRPRPDPPTLPLITPLELVVGVACALAQMEHPIKSATTLTRVEVLLVLVAHQEHATSTMDLGRGVMWCALLREHRQLPRTMHLGSAVGVDRALALMELHTKSATTMIIVAALLVLVVCPEHVTREMDLGPDARWSAALHRQQETLSQ